MGGLDGNCKVHDVPDFDELNIPLSVSNSSTLYWMANKSNRIYIFYSGTEYFYSDILMFIFSMDFGN